MKTRLVMALAVLLAACTSPPPAPIEERSAVVARNIQLEPDGRYRVRKGDTLWMIAFQFGLDHRELARWNEVAPPFVIFPDQLLTIEPPTIRPGTISRPDRAPARTAPVAAPRAETRPATTSPPPEPAGSTQKAPPERPVPSAGSPPGQPQWQWPAQGRLLRGFVANNPARSGYDIAGSQGQAISAAAAGRVVYSGSGLIGYGELIIIKHTDRLLSAYAHNQRRLVAEGDDVERGQLIAEMGRNDRNEVILHFEIRVDGRPVDPGGYLPGR